MSDFSENFLLSELTLEYGRAVRGIKLYLPESKWSEALSFLDEKNIDVTNYLNGLIERVSPDRDALEECLQVFNNTKFQYDHNEGLTAGVDDSIWSNITIAAIWWQLGVRFWKANKKEGFFLLLSSISLLQYSHGFSARESRLQDELDSKKQKVAGGKAKAACYSNFKAEVIRLLYEKKPEGGWKSKSEAIRYIDTDLCFYIETHGFPFSRENNAAEQIASLPRQIKDWSRDDPIIKAVFEYVVKKKKSAPKGA